MKAISIAVAGALILASGISRAAEIELPTKVAVTTHPKFGQRCHLHNVRCCPEAVSWRWPRKRMRDCHFGGASGASGGGAQSGYGGGGWAFGYGGAGGGAGGGGGGGGGPGGLIMMPPGMPPGMPPEMPPGIPPIPIPFSSVPLPAVGTGAPGILLLLAWVMRLCMRKKDVRK